MIVILMTLLYPDYIYVYIESLFFVIIPAVDQYWSLVWLVLSVNLPEVVEDWSSVLWYPVVRPGGEVVLHHFTRGSSFPSVLIIIIKLSCQLPAFEIFSAL